MTWPVTVLLVRHAWAGVRSDGPDDGARPLDAAGRLQADRLPDHLDARLTERGFERLTSAGDGVELLSSPLVRCVDTLGPLARRLGREIATDRRLAEGKVPLLATDGWPDAAYLGSRALAAVDAAATRSPAGGVLVVCAHGEVLPALVAVLAGRGDLEEPVGVDLTAKRLPKGAAWLLPAGGDAVVEFPPVPAGS